ncbi:MAG: hypothetical protein LBS12_03310, partial [Prevotellaceae bacterium]|nr:hypothetical protein [Prevotellaceae bacterium]
LGAGGRRSSTRAMCLDRCSLANMCYNFTHTAGKDTTFCEDANLFSFFSLRPLIYSPYFSCIFAKIKNENHERTLYSVAFFYAVRFV